MGSASDFEKIFQNAGKQYNVDPDLLKAVAQQESNFNTKAISPKGASGLMQLMPDTAKQFGVSDATDPTQNINAGAKYLSQMINKYGDVEKALSAYNWGPGNYDKFQEGKISSMPKETNDYLNRISTNFSKIKSNSGFVQNNNDEQQNAQIQSTDINQDPILMALNNKQQINNNSNNIDSDPILSALSNNKQNINIQNQQNKNIPINNTQTFASRVGKGLMDPIDAGAQMLTHAIPESIVSGVNKATSFVNELPVIGGITKALGMVPATPNDIDKNITESEKQYQQQRLASGNSGLDTGRLLGNLISTAPLMAAAPAGAGIKTGAAIGAATGSLTPVTSNDESFAKQKIGQALLGGAAGGVGSAVIGGIGKALSGVTNESVKDLASRGVNMTPGQILGGSAARTEEKLTSVPGIGDLIKNSQRKSIESFNQAVYNKVLEPLGEKYSGPIGHDAISNIKNIISKNYDDALSKLTFNARDPNFVSDITNLGNLAKNLPNNQSNTFLSILRNQIFDKIGPNGTADGQTLKGIQSELTRISKGYANDPSFDNRQLGLAINEIKNSVSNSIKRTNPQNLVDQLNKADSAYANYTRLRMAAASTGAGSNKGVFTPSQLSNAVRNQDNSLGKGSYATGNALMQDLSSNAQSILGSKYPDSGTAGRSMIGLGLSALAGHAVLPPAAMAATATGVGLGMLPYTSIGQKIAQQLLLNRPAFAPAIGKNISTYGTALGPVIGSQLINQQQNR